MILCELPTSVGAQVTSHYGNYIYDTPCRDEEPSVWTALIGSPAAEGGATAWARGGDGEVGEWQLTRSRVRTLAPGPLILSIQCHITSKASYNTAASIQGLEV